MRWIGAVFQLAIFVAGGLTALSLKDENWIMAAVYAGVGFGIWVAMNIRIVEHLEEDN